MNQTTYDQCLARATEYKMPQRVLDKYLDKFSEREHIDREVVGQSFLRAFIRADTSKHHEALKTGKRCCCQIVHWTLSEIKRESPI